MTCAESLHSQHGRCLRRPDAIGPAAIGDNLPIARKLGDSTLELGERHVERTSDVTSLVFLRWTNINHCHFAHSDSRSERLPINRLEDVLSLQKLAREPLELGKMGYSEKTQNAEEFRDRFVGEPLTNRRALPCGLDQPCSPEDLQELGGVRLS